MLLHCFWREVHKEMSPSYRKEREQEKYFHCAEFPSVFARCAKKWFSDMPYAISSNKEVSPFLANSAQVLGSFRASRVSPEGSLPVSKHDPESPRSGKLGTVTKFPTAARVSPEEGLSGSELSLQSLSQHQCSLAAAQESAPSWSIFFLFLLFLLGKFLVPEAFWPHLAVTQMG